MSNNLSNMFIVGIDENGFGPKLGPLIVTGSIFEFCDNSLLTIWDKKNKEQTSFSSIFQKKDHNTTLSSKVKDSKVIFKNDLKSKAKGEDIALSYYYLLFQSYPNDVDDFINSISLPPLFSNISSCENKYHKICWTPKLTIPVWGNSLPTISSTLKTNLLEVKSVVCCPGEFNMRLKRKPNKILLNLSYFERLINYFSHTYGSNILYLCGKVGGIKDYLKYSSFLSKDHQCQSLAIHEDFSTYYSSSLGIISFIKNGDQGEFPIALASIFGKYIREIFMERLNNNFSPEIRNNRFISGYYNSITDQFIKNVFDNQTTLDIPDYYLQNCFLRIK
ncbi:MAG: hypothetical protein V1872_02900 [bacterium]